MIGKGSIRVKNTKKKGSEGFHCVKNHNNNKYQIQLRELLWEVGTGS